MPRAQKKISQYLPDMKVDGVPYMAGASKGGTTIQHAEIAQAGGSPFAVTFAALNLSEMADASYQVMVNGPNGDERCDYTTRTVLGFSIAGGADTENLGLVIVGRLKGQAT